MKRLRGFASFGLPVLLCASTVIGVSGAAAQDGPDLVSGIQQNHDYVGYEPFESVDVATGNVMLTFIDLELPGNAGRPLRLQRTYNSRRSTWSFGLAGLPTRITEKSWPDPQTPIVDTPDGMAPWTPLFNMSDGGDRRTVFLSTPNSADPESLRWVISGQFWKYDRIERKLYIPDGTICEYTTDLRLAGCADPFQNAVTLEWDAGALTVTQHLGNGQSRVVTVAIDDNWLLPMTMSFGDKTWTYQYQSGTFLIEHVIPPAGAAWDFEYNANGRVSLVRTPLGGEVAYEYILHPVGGLAFWQLSQRATGGRAIDHPGVTTYTYPGDTVIVTPDNTRVTYSYGELVISAEVIDGGTGVDRRIVEASQDGTYVEVDREVRQHEVVAVVERGWGTPELTRRTVTRYGREYVTYQYYSPDHFGDYHRPFRSVEVGESGSTSRSTVREFDYAFTPYITGKISRSTVSVNGETAIRSWAYNHQTGFLESETTYGITTSFTPDGFGNVATVTNGNGTSTTYSYSRGVVSQLQTSAYTVTRAISSDGTIASETQAGRTTTYPLYDGLFRLRQIQPPGTNPIAIEYEIPAESGWTKTTRGNSWTKTKLDGFGRPVQTENSVGVQTLTEYDALGRVMRESLPFAPGGTVGTTPQFSTTTYDALGRVLKTINPDGSFRTRSYGAATITIADENNHATVQTYEAFGDPDDGRLVKVRDANLSEWTYGYTAVGHLRSVTAPDGVTRTWNYNANYLLASETHPESGTTLYLEYDGAGNLKKQRDARLIESTYDYDGNNRVRRIASGTSVTEIGYEPGSDNRVSMRNAAVSTTFEYDAATGRLTHRRDVVGPYVFDSRYGYDGNDQLVQVTYPSGRVVRYDVDGEQRITRVFETTANGDREYAAQLTYHPGGGIAGYTASNGIGTSITYHPTRYWIEGITAGPLQLTYGPYDPVGNVSAIGDSHAGNQTFTYDALDRLTRAEGPYGPIDYPYDAHGNRQTANNTTYEYDPATLRLLRQGDRTFTYFDNGNLRTAPNASYTYTPDNLLASATVPGGTRTYAYDADGWRAKKTTAGETIYYQRGLRGELLSEWHLLGTTASWRDYVYAGSRLLSFVEKPANPFPITCGGESIPDGSPTALSIAAGETGSFTFQASACRRVSAVINTSTIGNCSVMYHRFNLVNPDNSPLASTPNLCAGAIVGPVVVPTSGTHNVVLDPYGTYAGDATVSVYDVVDVTGPIALGQAVNAPLLTPGQRGVWTFTGVENQRVSVVVNTSTVTNCSLMYHGFKLLDPNGAPVGSIGSLCSGATIEPVALLTSGTYTVVADPYSSLTGELALTGYEVVDVTGPVTLNGPAVNAALFTPGQRAVWTFTGVANQRVSAVINTSTVANCSLMYHAFKMLDPNGAPVGSIASLCAGATIEPVVLPSNGAYTIVVDPYSSLTGQVAVSAFEVVDVTGPVTVNGPAVNAALSTPGQRGVWTFAGTNGMQVRALIDTSTVGLCSLMYHAFRILKPDGNPLISKSGLCAGTVVGPTTLPADGVYSVVVDPYANYTGQVTVRVVSP